MSDLLDLHRIATDADYALALDELEQLRDADSERARELWALIAEYEGRVARALARAFAPRRTADDLA